MEAFEQDTFDQGHWSWSFLARGVLGDEETVWGRGVASALEARLILKEKGPGVDTGEGEQWHDCTGFSPGLKERSSFPQMV